MARPLLRWVAAILACMSAQILQAAPQADLQPIVRLREFRFQADRGLLDAADAVIRQAMAEPARRPAIASALEAVALSDAAFDARQFACRRLVFVASEAQAPGLARLLHDDALGHYALMVLDRIPGPAVGKVVRAEAPRLKPPILAGALDLLGERREAASLKLLADMSRSRDAVVSCAAIGALAKLGMPAADAVLAGELAPSAGARRQALAEAILSRGQTLAKGGSAKQAAALCAPLDRPGEPPAVRAAALRIVATAAGSAAAPSLVKALDGRDRLRANAAATALREIRGQTVTGALTTALPRVSPAGRARLLDVIAERGDPGAAAAVATAMEDADAGVRLRAIAALGRLGGDRAAKPLLVVAGRGSADEKAAAAVAIGMLRGTGVASRLTDALGDGAAAVRAAALTALRARRDDVPLPVVVRMAQTDKGEPRTAALAALRDLGGVAEARALVDMLARPGVEEPEAVASTVAHIARKHPGGIEPVRAALARTKGAPERGVLLTCLGEIGGPAALESLTAALGDGDGDVQMAALRALAEWPTPEPTAALRDLAGKPPSERVRAVAFRGYVRMLRQSGNVATGAQGFGHAIELARSDDEKRLLLSGLATVGSADALALAIGLSASPGLRAEAEMAALAIAQMTAAAWPNDTRDALAKLAASAADEGLRAKATALMATMGKFGDFVLVWEVSPSYEREGANFTHLFDLAFPPETGAPDAEVGWRAMPVGTAPDQPWLLDLLALHGGEQKVAYLRTSVHADTARDLVLEIGSDDGPKVWWNGQVVFANNTPRAAAPGQDKVTVGVKAGWNSLMVKVTQNVMGWGLVARFTEADGAPATALRFALPSMVGEPPAAATR